MKTLKYIIVSLLLATFLTAESCGPVLVSARLSNPPPPWFYPNRIESIRYVYFPDHLIYYDLSLRSYIYLDNNVWITAVVLPPRYNGVNLRRSRTIRINNFFGDDIQNYHRENNSKTRDTRKNKGRRNN